MEALSDDEAYYCYIHVYYCCYIYHYYCLAARRILRFIRRAVALARMLPTLDLSYERWE